MSYLGACGKHEDHEGHWVTQPPEGGVGGHYCDGSASAWTEQELLMLDLFTKRDGES